MSPVQLTQQGLRMTGTPLWLDACKKTSLSFVSHAHADHIARHERVIATGPTLRLMAHRLGALPAALPVAFNRPFELGNLTLELLPAGHILGSAQIRIIRDDGERIVYTGDLNLASSSTAEPAQVAECDVLVMESTFGHPRYVFPPREDIYGAMVSWVRSQLEREIHPVLLGYPLGKSQEAIRQLTSRGFAVRVHRKVWDMVKLYAEEGVDVGPVQCFEGELRPGEVAVFPPSMARSSAVQKLRPRAVAALTGWALDGPGNPRTWGADVAFALSDHADFPSLVDYAEKTGAREVITCHGFARELAQALMDKGICARALGQPLQLGFGFAERDLPSGSGAAASLSHRPNT